eukprot:6201598-Pleurochrysis_carterae.AAC.5
MKRSHKHMTNSALRYFTSSLPPLAQRLYIATFEIKRATLPPPRRFAARTRRAQGRTGEGTRSRRCQALPARNKAVGASGCTRPLSHVEV